MTAARLTYLVECFVPDLRTEEVARRSERAKASAHGVKGDGPPLEFAGAIALPEDEVVFYLFEGGSPELVGEACRQADISYERVVPCVWTSHRR